MDPIASYIVRRIRHNNALEEAELAEREVKKQKSVWRTLLNLLLMLSNK